MKKIIALTTLIFAFCSFSYGQLPINFGIAGGASSSVFSSNVDSIVTEGKVGWQGGLFLRLKIKKFYLGTEAMLTSRPGSFKSNSGQSNGEITVVGMDVPILAGFKIVDAKVFNWRVYLGPNMNFAFQDKIKISTNGSSLSNTEDIQFKGGPHWSGMIGTGIDISLVTIDLRYGRSFSNWSNRSDATINNQLIQATVGIKFF